MTTKIMPATELRTRISRILDELIQTDEPVFVTRHGRAQAVLLSVATYDALTQHADRPDQVVTEPLNQYRAILNRIDFSEHGDASARLQHARAVYDELAEARHRANSRVLDHE